MTQAATSKRENTARFCRTWEKTIAEITTCTPCKALHDLIRGDKNAHLPRLIKTTFNPVCQVQLLAAMLLNDPRLKVKAITIRSSTTFKEIENARTGPSRANTGK